MQSHIETPGKGLPEAFRTELLQARKQKGWSQAELGRRAGLPQVHIWGIETGKTVPRVDTLLNLLRLLDRDLLIVPRALVPAAQSLVRNYTKSTAAGFDDEGERPLYEPDEEDREGLP